MKKWIEFNIKYPKSVLAIILFFTIIAIFGLKNIRFDSSTDSLMPKGHSVYKMLQRSKKIFGESKTFVITSIEASGKYKLFSYPVFKQVEEMVNELEEYRTFSPSVENKRLNDIMALANIKVKKNNIKQKQIKNKLDDDIGDELGSEFNDKKDIKVKKSKKKSLLDSNIWRMPLKEDFYAKPTRIRNTYNYENYKKVKIETLLNNLDEIGRKQLRTILIEKKMSNLSTSHILTKAEFKKIFEAWETLYLYKSMEVIRNILDPVSGKAIVGTDKGLFLSEFIKTGKHGKRIIPKTKKEFIIYKKKLLNNPAFESFLFALDNKSKIIALSMTMTMRPIRNHSEIFNYLYTLIQKYNKKPLKLTTMGSSVYQKFLQYYMVKDFKRFIPIVLLVVVLIFFLNFRTFRGVLLPTLSVIISTLWTVGLMGYLKVPITLVVNMLPPLLIAIGSSYSIHILNQYYLDQKLILTEGKAQGLKKSMMHVSLTVILAAVTTFVGFLTLVINEIVSLRDFGLFAAIGTIMSMVVSVMLIPSSLVLMKLINNSSKKDCLKSAENSNRIVSKIIKAASYLSLKKSKLVVVVSLIFICIFGFGISKIYVESSSANILNKDSFLYKADQRLGKMFKGFMVINLVVDSGKAGGAKGSEFLKFVERIRKWIVSEENQRKYHILHTVSFGDVIKRFHKAMNNENIKFYKIPDKQSTINEYLELYSGKDSDSDGRIDSLESLICPNYRYVNIIIRKGSYKGKPVTTRINYRGQKHVIHYLNKLPEAKKYSWEFTGESINFIVLGDMIIKGQIQSVVLTLFIIAIIILILFKNWKAALVSLIPISTSVIFVYGLMGYIGMPLDIAKGILAAIAIGIGVDDTIHMLKTFRFNLKKGMPVNKAMVAAHKQAGLAIVYTSIALICGFSVLLFSEFTPIFSLGLLVSLTMLGTTISALFLLPSVIVFFKIPIDKEIDNRFFKKINIGD